ncbi:PAAR domain-containing protein [Streptomyces sp. NPDC057638]|uniref:PAAR domain-containing protein n=1 Tax=Streptomyces sp. NPDC057638 TaxID=3346190 RepID=UPI00368CA83E
MPPAARTGDATAHGGVLALPPGAVRVVTVLINGRPPAVTGSIHTCPLHPVPPPANLVLPNPAALATGQVLIGGLPAARVRDLTTCGAMIVSGAPNVLIGGAP